MTALLIAAHGDGSDSESNQWAQDISRQAAQLGGFAESGVGFQKGEPGFDEALDWLSESEVVVVPLMASAGYYASVVLPRELARNATYGEKRLRITEPIGILPEFRRLAESRTRDVLRERDWDVAKTTIVVVGHGTRRHKQSRLSTIALQDFLAARLRRAQVLAAFLDEDPGPEEALNQALNPQILVLPFLMGAGTHATKDLPRRFGARPVHIDQPLGTLPGIEHLILQSAFPGVAL